MANDILLSNEELNEKAAAIGKKRTSAGRVGKAALALGLSPLTMVADEFTDKNHLEDINRLERKKLKKQQRGKDTTRIDNRIRNKQEKFQRNVLGMGDAEQELLKRQQEEEAKLRKGF